MVKTSKATKKFQKNHLSRELTKRKHTQKKAAQKEKSLAKYRDEAENGESKEGDGADGDEDAEMNGAADEETDVYQSKSKSRPAPSAAPRRPSASTKPAGAGKPAAKKAPQLEDLEVDQFMDGGFLDEDGEEVDDKGIDDEDDENEEDGEDGENDAAEDEDGDADMSDDEAARLQADIEAHEAELSKLAETDPEFFSHLQKEDAELLKFSKKQFDKQDQEDAEEEDDEERAEMHDVDEDESNNKQPTVLTSAVLHTLQKQCRTGSLKALKKLIRYFRSAVHIGSISEAKKKGSKVRQTQSEKDAEKESQFRQEIQIHSPRVFHELVRFVMKEGGEVFKKHFGLIEKSEGKKKKGGKSDSTASSSSSTAPTPFTLPPSFSFESHSRWSTLGPILKAFIGHTLFFLSTLHSSANEKMARFVLNALEDLVVFLIPFKKLQIRCLKELLEIWATCEKNVRIDAFLRIRQLAIELTSSQAGVSQQKGETMLEMILKGIYLTYVRHTKFTSELTLPIIEFMSNCIVEIYGLDMVMSYQHAFVYIRQLAIHLRQALQGKKKDSYRQVYNWNYVNTLRVWYKVLAAYGGKMESSVTQANSAQNNTNLHALIYPFIQICLTTLSVLPIARYFPLKFHIVRFLNVLSEQCQVFIPLAPHLLSIFQSPEFQRKPHTTTKKLTDLSYVLKVGKPVTLTKPYQEEVISTTLSLLLEYFNIYSYSIAYNELILPTIKLLKKYQKDTISIVRIKKQISGLILKLEHNASWILQQRTSSIYSPKDVLESKNGIDGISSFRTVHAKKQESPLEKYVVAMRKEKKELEDKKVDWTGEKSALMQQGKKGKKGAESDDDEDDEGDEEVQKYQQRNRGGDDDEGDDGEMDGDDDDEGGDDDDEADSDEQPRKKSKSNNGRAVAASAPFSYPADADEDGSDAEGDQLEELAFSDDEDENGRQKKTKGGKKEGKKSQKKKNGAASSSSSKKQPASSVNGVKQEKKRKHV